MSQVLSQKDLLDGATLQLVKYQLDEAGAKALGRPIGSDEIVLVLNIKNGDGGATRPRASWYLDEKCFRKLYDTIKNENDFRKVNRFLNNGILFSENDSDRIGSFLETS